MTIGARHFDDASGPSGDSAFFLELERAFNLRRLRVCKRGFRARNREQKLIG